MLRIGVGSALAIMIAGAFGLLYNTSAGIVTLLTIQDTKKETLSITLKRLVAFLLALILGSLSFALFGYNPIAFGMFLLLFVTGCSIFGLEDGISMSAVLMTHFYMQGKIDMPLILNEFLLLVIGMSIGIVLNLFIRSREKEIKEDQKVIDHLIRDILDKIAMGLLDNTKEGYENSIFLPLEEELDISSKKAYDGANNTLLSDTKYYIEYMEMRKNQSHVLMTIYNHSKKISFVPKQAYPISKFISYVSESFHEYNNAEELLKELEKLYEFFSKEPLPKDREEFESRAVLYQTLSELEYFLKIKRDFAIGLTEKQVEIYWKQ